MGLTDLGLEVPLPIDVFLLVVEGLQNRLARRESGRDGTVVGHDMPVRPGDDDSRFTGFVRRGGLAQERGE